jgi:large subunit ribosomal protein L10
MNRAEKNQIIDVLVDEINQNPNFYLTDISSLTVKKTNELRSLCFKRGVKLKVVKNTLLKKALERTGRDFSEIFPVLKGSTSIMFAEVGNVPAKLIQEFRKSNDKPILKAAYVEECIYLGDNQLSTLANIKSKNELIGEIIGLLQSPAKNIVSALQSGGNKLAGIVKTLSERPEK